MNINKAIQSAIRYYQTGHLQESESLCKEILKLQPDNEDALHILGLVCYQHKYYDLAIKYFKKILQMNPKNTFASFNLANSFRGKNILDEAITYYLKALQYNPNFEDAYYNLGVTYKEKGQINEAISSYQKALQLNPNAADVYNNIGLISYEAGQFDKAITCYQKALQINPGYAKAYYNLGIVFRDTDQLDEAITCYQKALQIDPNLAEAHRDLALALLVLGNFKEGWKEYEWRKKVKDHYQRNFPQPLWTGFNIFGKSILLHTELGFGDSIQYIRYAPLVAQFGAKVFVECQKELKSLFQKVDGVDQVIARGEQLPEFDIHCPLLSLPLIFNTSIETIPTNIPYIDADSILMQKWRNKVTNKHSKLKIGLVWTTGITDLSKLKSFPLDTFSPLEQFDNITFYSLQKGDAAEQAKNPPKDMKLIDYTDEINDFSDTAALIKNLDLVISADTAVAHLAGALGSRIWILLSSVPIWPWMLHHENSPWYTTMKLFRQPSKGDWESVIDKVIVELQKLLDSN